MYRSTASTVTSPSHCNPAIDKGYTPGKPHDPPRSLEAGVLGFAERLKEGNTAIVGDSIHYGLSMPDLDGINTSLHDVADSLRSESVFGHIWLAAEWCTNAHIKGLRTNTSETYTQEYHPLRSPKEVVEPSVTTTALEYFLVHLTCFIRRHVGGPHYVSVDPRLYDDSSAMVRSTQRLVKLFQNQGVDTNNIIINIPATEAGILAAKELRPQGIGINLYLVSGLIHAAACVEADPFSITMAVGTLLEWYERRRDTHFHDLSDHPGIEEIQSTLAYFRLHNIKTKVIGTEFRTEDSGLFQLSEIGPLGEFDAICVSGPQAEELGWSKVPILPIADASTPSLRAQQAQYPTALLASKSGLMGGMSAETRSMMAATTYLTLGKLKVSMEAIEDTVRREVHRQYASKTVDLSQIFFGREVETQTPTD